MKIPLHQLCWMKDPVCQQEQGCGSSLRAFSSKAKTCCLSLCGRVQCQKQTFSTVSETKKDQLKQTKKESNYSRVYNQIGA